MQRFRDDDDGYIHWLTGHPDGFVLNTERTPKPAYLVLHRSSCPKISQLQRGATRWTRDYIKFCGRRTELEALARDEVGGEPRSCGICRHRCIRGPYAVWNALPFGTLSEYVRDLLLEAVVPIYKAEVKHGDEPAPESLRTIDQQVLSLLHRILACVLPEEASDVDGDREYQLERAKIIEERSSASIVGGRSPASAPSCRNATAVAYPTSSRCSGPSPSASTT